MLFPPEISAWPNTTIGSYFARSFGEQPLWKLFLLFLVSHIAAVSVHELGHLLGGLSAQMKVNYIRIGPLKIIPPLHLSWVRWQGFNGRVSMAPSEKDPSPWRQFLFSGGGVLANFTGAGVVLAVQLSTGTLSAALSMFVLISLTSGVLNFIPGWLGDSGSAISDGDLMRMALFHRNQSIGTHLWERLAANSEAYRTALKDKRDDDAAIALEKVLALLDYSDNREEWFFQAVSFQAIRRKRFDLAKQWLDDIPQETEVPGLHLQGEAALLVGHNQLREALEKIDQCEALVSRLPENYTKERKLQSLQKWKRELRQEESFDRK